MIDIRSTAPATVNSLAMGGLFIPGKEHQQRFLAGLVNTIPVKLCVDGEKPFAFSSDWSRAPGVVCDNVRIEVDPDSAVLADEMDSPLGAVLRLEGATAIMATPADQYSLSRVYPVHIEQCDKPRDIQRGDIAFTRWRIVHGEPAHPAILFEHDLTKAP